MLNERGVRRFDVMIGEQCRENLSEEGVEDLYRTGVVNQQTRCRTEGAREWQTIDECLPILKYVHRNATAASAAVPAPVIAAPVSAMATFRRSSINAEHDDRRKPALTSSLKAGWICFGIGAAVAWIFPPAYFFYSVALVMAIVAMCTHQVNRGIILLLSSFVAMGTSALLSFTLAIGLFAAAAKPAVDEMQRVMDQARRDSEALQRSQRRMEQELQRSQAEMSRSLDRSMEALRSSAPAIPQNVTRPVRVLPAQTPAQHDMLEEIARLETKQRQLRQTGRDLDPLTQEYMTRLRAAYDSSRAR